MADFVWDKWQKDVLDYDGHITIRSGRQVGKSEVISAKAAKFALDNVGTVTMVIAASQRQSSLLLSPLHCTDHCFHQYTHQSILLPLVIVPSKMEHTFHSKTASIVFLMDSFHHQSFPFSKNNDDVVVVTIVKWNFLKFY